MFNLLYFNSYIHYLYFWKYKVDTGLMPRQKVDGKCTKTVSGFTSYDAVLRRVRMEEISAFRPARL